MSDITIQLQLPEAKLEHIERDGDDISLHFSKVFLVQEMEGAFEDSLWTQAVSITISDCEIDGDLPACPCELRGGDFIDNIYTYRNHVTLPISWRAMSAAGLTRAMAPSAAASVARPSARSRSAIPST